MKRMVRTVQELSAEEKLRLICGKDFWHTVQVLRDPRGKRLARIAIIWKGFAAGVRFAPQIAYLP